MEEYPIQSEVWLCSIIGDFLIGMWDLLDC